MTSNQPLSLSEFSVNDLSESSSFNYGKLCIKVELNEQQYLSFISNLEGVAKRKVLIMYVDQSGSMEDVFGALKKYLKD